MRDPVVVASVALFALVGLAVALAIALRTERTERTSGEAYVEWKSFNPPGTTTMCNGPAPPDPAHCTTDCQVSGWSACSAACGAGKQTRIVTSPPSNGGAPCPALERACEAPPCESANCEVSEWSRCSSRDQCGQEGTQTRFVTRKPAYGGSACPVLKRSCRGPECGKPLVSRLRAGYAVDVEGSSMAAGAKARMWTWSGGPNQQWLYDDAGRFVATHSGQCLDAYGAGTGNGTQIVQWPCHDGANQKWRWDGGKLHPGHAPGLCLDVSNSGTADGTKLQLWQCNGASAQEWTHEQKN